VSGVVSHWPVHNKSLTETGTGDRDRPVTGLSYFLKIRSVTMVDSDPDEDGSAEVSCQEQQNSEGDDDVEEVEASGSRASANPVSITSKSHTHPSHSETSRLLTSSLSFGVPVPRGTQCMRDV
jgi:hypothetical protein